MRIIASFSKPEEAHLVRAHLEGSGIAAFVRDDHTVTADWALSNAIGGVKVEVAEEDYAEAIAVLRAFVPPAPPPAPGNKPHSVGRYVKIFLGCFAVTALIIGWQSGWSASDFLAMAIGGGILAACIAGLCAILDV